MSCWRSRRPGQSQSATGHFSGTAFWTRASAASAAKHQSQVFLADELNLQLLRQGSAPPRIGHIETLSSYELLSQIKSAVSNGKPAGSPENGLAGAARSSQKLSLMLERIPAASYPRSAQRLWLDLQQVEQPLLTSQSVVMPRPSPNFHWHGPTRAGRLCVDRFACGHEQHAAGDHSFDRPTRAANSIGVSATQQARRSPSRVFGASADGLSGLGDLYGLRHARPRDIRELWALRDERFAVMCGNTITSPRSSNFESQSAYPKAELVDAAELQPRGALTPEYVNNPVDLIYIASIGSTATMPSALAPKLESPGWCPRAASDERPYCIGLLGALVSRAANHGGSSRGQWFGAQ